MSSFLYNLVDMISRRIVLFLENYVDISDVDDRLFIYYYTSTFYSLKNRIFAKTFILFYRLLTFLSEPVIIVLM